MRVRFAPLDSTVDVTAPPELARPLRDLLDGAEVTGRDVATAEVPVGPAGVATRAAVTTGSTFMIVVPVLLPLAPPRRRRGGCS